MHRHVSLIVDIHHARCGACKMALLNELATTCPGCGSVFERIQSNHAGLALKFEYRRAAAGVFEPRAAVAADESDGADNTVARPLSTAASASLVHQPNTSIAS